MAGLMAAGAYIPRTRLRRRDIAAAHEWFAPGLKSLAKGERAVSNWDEDVITMAVEAARDCLDGCDRAQIAKIALASTTHPNSDRQNAAVVKEALDLGDDIGSLDVSGSQRAATSALLAALESASGGGGPVLCLSAEKRRPQPASELEIMNADAAAAVLVGSDPGAAEFVSGHSLSVDFIDHFRSTGQPFDYSWEGRWARDEGYGKLAPAAIEAALAKAGLTAGAITRFIMAAPMKGVNEAVARAAGIAPDRVQDSLSAQMGDAGAAHPLIMLVHALETAMAGDLLMLVGFGQGCDVLIFRATGARAMHGLGVSGWLRRRKQETNYVRYLALAGLLELDAGMRAELDQKTALSALYRNRRTVMALVGGRCTQSGSVQFPRSDFSVAPNDRARGTQEDYPLADRRARVVTYTADNLTYTPDPPCWYGAVEFEEGGRLTVEFTDLDAEEISVGVPMRMMFRIKAADAIRGFSKYFWKAVPDYRIGTAAPLAAE